MRRKLLWISIFLLKGLIPRAQLIDNFDDNILTNWFTQSCYVLAETNQELSITATNAFNYQVFNKQSLNENFSIAKVLYLKIKTSSAVTVRIDLGDVSAKTTNASALSVVPIADGEYHVYSLDFNNRFRQSFPSPSLVDSTAITQVIIFLNPTGPSFTGNVFIDSVGHDLGIILPIHFVSFAGQLNGNKVNLSFKVAEETGVDKYVIQKSGDNLQWQSAGELSPLNTSATAEYSFTDAAPASGNTIYRIEMIKKNGAVSYSELWQYKFKGTVYKPQLVYTSQGKYQLIFKNIFDDRPKVINTYSVSGQLLQQITLTSNQTTIPINQRNGGFAVVKYESGKQEVVKLNYP